MTKNFLLIVTSVFACAIICSTLSGFVWFLLFQIFPSSGGGGGFVPIFGNETWKLAVYMLVFFGAFLGIIIGLIIGIFDFQMLKGAIAGGIISFLIILLIALALSAEASSRGSAENVFVLIPLLSPQYVISAVSGLVTSAVLIFARKIIGD